MVLGNLLFFMMLFAPRGWQLLKMPLVVIAATLLLSLYISKQRISFHRFTVAWFAILLSYGFIWSFLGVINSNPGVFDFFRLNVVWVLLYALFVFTIDSMDKFKSLLKTMVWAAIAISLYNIAKVLNAVELIPNINALLRIDDLATSAIGLHEGYIQLTSHNIGTLTFLAPFLMGAYVMKTDEIVGISRKTMVVAVILSLLTVLISGRRALWLEIMLAPIFIVIFNFFRHDVQNKNLIKSMVKSYSIAILFLLVFGYFLSTYFGWSFAATKEHFVEAFSAEDVRTEQALALWNGFKESPVFGTGFGVGVPEVVRNEQFPWIYELSYLLILYNTGLLGSFIYAVCLGLIYYYGYRIIKNNLCDKSVMIPLLVGFTCFLIANATNPYFSSYDFMWVLFLPICYINVILTERNV